MIHTALVTAILVATAPSTPPENVAAFFSDDGPEICQALAVAFNSAETQILYVCEVHHG